MNNELLQEKALQYALGTLPSGEIDEFEGQLLEDRALQETVHEWQRINELDAQEVPQVGAPFQLYSRIMDTIDSEAARNREIAVDDRASSGGRVAQFIQWSGWALAACVAVVFSLLALRPVSENDGHGDIVLSEMSNPGVAGLAANAENEATEDDRVEDRMLELAELAETYWISREGLDGSHSFEENASANVALSVGGFTIFDRRHNIGFIAVENMPEQEEGKSYHVWAKTNEGDSLIRAGALPIGDSSRGLFFFDLSRNKDYDSDGPEVSFFVTEEKVEKPSAPEGKVLLSGI